VLEHFVGSRALRRLVLTAPPPGVDTAFGASLWAAVLDGRCARWVGTHAEKVRACVACVRVLLALRLRVASCWSSSTSCQARCLLPISGQVAEPVYIYSFTRYARHLP